jgi:hypothetical protein
VLFLVILLTARTPAAAPEKPVANLVANGAFTSSLSGWKVSEGDSNAETGVPAWSRLDAGGSKASGSLELVTSATGDRDTFRIGQCFRIAPGVENLSFGARIRVPPVQRARGIANLEIERFRSPDCSDDPIPFEGLGGITNADFWSSRREIVAAADTRSARLVASVTKFYEWRGDDEIGETDDGNLFRAYFDDVFAAVLEKGAPGGRDLVPADASRFTRASAPSRRERWGSQSVEAPALTLAVLDADGHPHAADVVAECSSIDAVRLAVTLKSPYPEDDPRHYPLQPVVLAGEGSLGPRPTVELGLFQAGDRERKLVPISCNAGPSVELRVLGDRTQRAGGIRAFYDCLRTSLPEDSRARVPERLSDDELLAWRLANSIVANPAGEYEVVARYAAREAGFWHEPVLSNPAHFRIVRKEPCPSPRPASDR